jgi:hypothetical protein
MYERQAAPQKWKTPLEGMSGAFGSSAEAATGAERPREEERPQSVEADYPPAALGAQTLAGNGCHAFCANCADASPERKKAPSEDGA